jgi:hypothetical protein
MALQGDARLLGVGRSNHGRDASQGGHLQMKASINNNYPLKKDDRLSVSLNDVTINLTVVDNYNGCLIVRSDSDGACMKLKFDVSYEPVE